MKSLRQLLLIPCATVYLFLSQHCLGDGLPAFVKVGKSFKIQDQTVKVIETDPTGWVKLRIGEKFVWLNLNKIDSMEEID